MIETKQGLTALLAATWVLAAISAANARQPEIAPDEVRVSVAGIVRDPKGQPVEGAVVVAGIIPWEFDLPRVVGRQVVKTGPDGRYRFSLVGHEAIVSQSRLTLCAYKEPFSPVCQMKDLRKPDPPPPAKVDQATAKAVRVDGVRQVEVAELAGDVELVLEVSAPFVGSVKDQAGRQVGGASVRFEGIRRETPDGIAAESILPPQELVRGTLLESLYFTRSDKGGKFRFPALPPGTRLLLLVEAKGMADLRTRPISGDLVDPLAGYLAGTEAEPAKLEIGPAARVKRRVVAKLPGVKTSGLKVFAQEIDGSRNEVYRNSAGTNAEGRFVLAGLDESTINIFLDDHPAAGEWTYRAVPNLELSPGVTKDVEIELIRGTLAEGTVVDQAGRAVAGAWVGLYGPIRPRSGACIIGDRTDRDGRYRFRLPPGETYFYIFDPPQGYAPLPQEGSSQLVEIPADAVRFQVPPIPLRRLAGE